MSEAVAKNIYNCRWFIHQGPLHITINSKIYVDCDNCGDFWEMDTDDYQYSLKHNQILYNPGG